MSCWVLNRAGHPASANSQGKLYVCSFAAISAGVAGAMLFLTLDMLCECFRQFHLHVIKFD